MASNLQTYLEGWADADPVRIDVAAVIGAIAAAAIRLADLVALGPLAGSLATVVGDNADGDVQKELDLRAHELFLDALRTRPVAVLASEESADPVALNPAGSLAVAIDPLDGSSNIDTNVSIGTIFSILPTFGAAGSAFLQRGTSQLAAGFVMYGPHTALVLTLRHGVQIFTLDRRIGAFLLTTSRALIPRDGREYAINASNYRHWDEAIRAYVDDCVAGAEGPCGADFNMRWIACLVAEAFRILVRGGIYLYPRDARSGYRNGRLRLIYEANPLALIVENAGGAATDGAERILDIEPHSLHERVPLVFGSRDTVERVAAFHSGGLPAGERSPLFARRSLFRV